MPATVAGLGAAGCGGPVRPGEPPAGTPPVAAPAGTPGQATPLPDGRTRVRVTVGYYAPGNDLVLCYGDKSYHSGIVIIGRLDGDAAGRLAEMDGAATVTVEADAG